jgi:tetratricopeptide (TPR) repeat protein
VKRAAIVGAAALVAGLAAAVWWWTLRDPVGPREAAAPADPPAAGTLPYDETVDRHWVDEETGAADVWKLTKKDTAAEDRAVGPALPEPDPDAGDHVPDESARALTSMGLESWKRGEVVDAMAQLGKAIEVDPDDPLPRTHYGRLQILAMEYTQALPHLERAAALQPDDPQVWLDLATLYEKARILDRAWEAHRRAEELAGEADIYQDETTGFWIVPGTSIFP